MSERSGFFPYVQGDANSEYDHAFLAKWVASFIGNGIYNGDLAVAAGSNMQVVIPSGQAWINGYYYKNGGDLILPIANADGVLNRKDTVVLRWDINQRSITALVLQGTPASSPTAPVIVRTAEQYDLKLAEIRIPAGTTAITQALITDTRLDESVCGLVHAVVDHIDTTKLYQQIQNDLAGFKSGSEAGFKEWFNSIKDILGEDEAAKLLNKINANSDDLTAHKNDTVAHMTQEQKDKLATSVPNTRKINGHELMGDINISADDVGARPITWMPTAAQVGARPLNLTQLSNVDFNTITANGLYRVFTPSANYPPGYTSDSDFFANVLNIGDTFWVRQIVYDVRSGAVFYHYMTNGTWCWTKPAASTADTASGSVALTSPGVRNLVIGSSAPSDTSALWMY